MKALATLGVLFAVIALAATAEAQGRKSVTRTQPWPEATLRAVARLPVQADGRIKPLDTFAQFQLLALNGKRSVTIDEDTKLTAIEWLLDCLFFPEQAWDYECVVVDDARVVESIGLSAEGKERRDRYSMRELEPGFTRLGEVDHHSTRRIQNETQRHTPLHRLIRSCGHDKRQLVT